MTSIACSPRAKPRRKERTKRLHPIGQLRVPIACKQMCLIIVESRIDAEMPLLVAANRDEKLERAAVTATVLQATAPRIIGGRDLVAHGTWLAVNEHGVVAGLTNRPSSSGRDPSKRSRGELPLALAQHETAEASVDDFLRRFTSGDFNLGWLLVGDRRSLYYLTLNESGPIDSEALEPGLHVLGNGPLREPSPKTDLVMEHLAQARPTDLGVVAWLHRVLGDHTLPSGIDGSLENRARQLQAACVHTEDYGTRSAALVTVPPDGTPNMWVADGPPCRTPFVSVDHLWHATAKPCR